MSQSPPSAAPATLGIDAARAVVEWTGADGQKQYLYQPGDDASLHITFDVQFDAATDTALLKLRAPLGLRSLPKRTPLYLYVQGDTITSLIHDVPDVGPEIVTSTLGPASHRLQLCLAQPPHLIAPHVSLVPKNKFHGDAIDSLKLLARVTLLTVYFVHPSISITALEHLCDAACARRLQPAEEATDLRGLYGARGGRILQGVDLCLPSKGPSLPSYNEVAAKQSDTSPKPAGVPGPSVKRRRGSISGSEERQDMALVAATCTTIVEGMMSRFRQEQQAYLDSQLQELKTSVTADMQQLKEEVMEHITERLNDFSNSLPTESDIDAQISQHVGSFEDLMDVKIDDSVAGVKMELEEFVDEEVAAIEERVMDRIRDSSWTINLQE